MKDSTIRILLDVVLLCASNLSAGLLTAVIDWSAFLAHSDPYDHLPVENGLGASGKRFYVLSNCNELAAGTK